MKSPDTRIFFVPELQLGYARFMKCGSTAIVEALKAQKLVTEHKKRDYVRLHNDPVVTFWRDPFARIESAYAYFRMPKRKGFRELGRDFPSLASFEKFVVDVSMWPDEKRDQHFRSQTIQEHKLTVDCRVAWNFERMEEIFGITIDKQNASAHGPALRWTREMTLTFEKAFADDLTMWEQIS